MSDSTGIRRSPNAVRLLDETSLPDAAALFQLKTVYGWLSHRLANVKPTLDHFESCWSDFLPAERAHFVRRALFIYTTNDDYPGLRFSAMALSAGYTDNPTEEELAHLDTIMIPKTPWAQLCDLLVDMRAACMLDRSLKSSFAHWERRFFASDIGITRRKLKRMGPDMCSHVLGRLVADLAKLKNPRHVTRPNDFLPSADEGLADAYDAVQTSLQRFKIYLGFVENLYSLYHRAFSRLGSDSSVDLLVARRTLRELEARPDVDPFLLGASRQNVREHEARHAPELVPLARALGQLTAPNRASSATALKGFVLFDPLSLAEQVSAVNSTRELVFEACKLVAEGHALPASQHLVARLSTAVRGTCFDAEGHASLTHQLDAHSLSHRARHPRISARYAQRYYGTTAASWESERGGARA
ncbi:hypothetical protein JCM9279_003449 [Rhodotorula babjevae]